MNTYKEKDVDFWQATVCPDCSARQLACAVLTSFVFVFLTRWFVLRPGPFETDEYGYLSIITHYQWPMHHTLFLAMARLAGRAVENPYLGFLMLDMAVSACALSAVWWWLRALVRPATALAATLMLAVAPLFWAYGAMAGNYTAIPLVGSVLLGIAVRTWKTPRHWHPFAAAAVLAWGTGYRQDIGIFWLPVFFVILWRHRWARTVQSLFLFAVLNLAWLIPMLCEVGWAHYREGSGEFAHRAGYLNSVGNLGLIDAPVRYGVKIGVALLWTFGPAILIVPRGLVRILSKRCDQCDRFAGMVLILSVVPALCFHLTIHFGVPGYAFHYVPALTALIAIGISRPSQLSTGRSDLGPIRLLTAATVLALVFLLYPTNYDRPGMWGDFDLAFGRHTRVGLQTRPPHRNPSAWRTANSRPVNK